MSRITNKHIIKIKELISEEVCMGTFGLVELELLEMEKSLLEAPKNTSSNSEYKQICKNCKHWFDCFAESTNICEHHIKFERKDI